MLLISLQVPLLLLIQFVTARILLSTSQPTLALNKETLVDLYIYNIAEKTPVELTYESQLSVSAVKKVSVDARSNSTVKMSVIPPHEKQKGRYPLVIKAEYSEGVSSALVVLEVGEVRDTRVFIKYLAAATLLSVVPLAKYVQVK